MLGQKILFLRARSKKLRANLEMSKEYATRAAKGFEQIFTKTFHNQKARTETGHGNIGFEISRLRIPYALRLNFKGEF